MADEARGLRFLVVEDHAFQRRILVQLLQRLGAAAVHEAEDGEAALTCLRARPAPDVVISDLWMPGMDGMQLMRHIGAGAAGVAVILTSALDADARASIAEEARACGVRLLAAVEKPLTPAKLTPLLAAHRSGAQ